MTALHLFSPLGRPETDDARWEMREFEFTKVLEVLPRTVAILPATTTTTAALRRYYRYLYGS